jgi:sigma-B regulation protein RsbU (phosphoserine phosphatase)
MTKILVVDDEPDVELLIRQKFSKQIKSKEFDFLFAANGKEALKILADNRDINIILTDINMPEMDGLVLLSHLPELNRLYKAIIVSAYGDMSNIRRAMNQGACDFITKPIDFSDLEITIANTIKQYITLDNALKAALTLSSLEKEIAIASSIQQAVIPHQFTPLPSIKSFEIFGSMTPAKMVGGDFFDFFPLDDKRIGFLIADVSGKGIPAAFFMAMSRAIIRTIAPRATSPEECLKEANQMLCIDNDTCMFVTTFYGVYDSQTQTIECSNAGHNPPLLLKADQTIQLIAPNEGIPLGVQEQTQYIKQTIKLNPTDTLILYTDGITEAMTYANEQFGQKRFEESLLKWPQGSLPSLTKQILDDVAAFTAGAPISDDMTLLCLKQL